jgi:2-(1,2-epoxy-1,2-dihydrophenyl)acetyl-CoA isomerase
MNFVPDPDAPGLATSFADGALRLRFERPDRRNSLTRPMMQRMVSLVENAVDEPETRVIVLEGTGEHFCSGADLQDVNARSETKPRVGDIQRRVPRQAHRLIPALLRVQIPVVSIVRGIASGIGAHLAFASDFVVASRTVRFSEPFVKRGFTPDSGGTFLLARLVGLARAREIVLLGRQIDADTAERWELVHRVVPDDELESASEELIRELAAAPTIALGLTKSLLNRAFDSSLEDALGGEAFALELSSRTKDFKEGLAAFAEKRAPRYRGR